MNTERIALNPGTKVYFPSGSTYEIAGSPIGSGGGSILYPVYKLYKENEQWKRDGISYVLKECYPVSENHPCTRLPEGKVITVSESEESLNYLNRVKEMMLDEKNITQAIYETSSRLIPILDSARSVRLDIPVSTNINNSNNTKGDDINGDDTSVAAIDNTYVVMESLARKGRSLQSYMREEGTLTPLQTFQIVKQLLLSLKEIHNAGFLHLDIQDGNIFLQGSLSEESDILSMIDFGSARKLENGRTAPITDRIIFTTRGFSAPELYLHNDGNLQLGPEADIYSVGCLILLLLTGKRYRLEELLSKSSGRYITNVKMRKLDCPTHLTERMQEIIAKSLAPERTNRYQSAEEMFSDVNDFVKSLQPYRSDLLSVSYDAFICYKHGEIDNQIAKQVQVELEHFKMPHRFGFQKSPFKRVFLDEGELSSCADFGEQIRCALKNSGWLIVICSKDTPKSPWVSKEIQTFLQYHDVSRILTILTDGEPEESFPKELRGVKEAFAADCRGENQKERQKKLKNDVILRIAAPMLGVSFDALKQRHKAYLQQRIALFASCIALLATAFSFYAYRQTTIIRKQKDEIAKEYANTLISQSNYLVKESKELVDQNNYPAAVEKLLMALPGKEQERPVIADAVYGLTDTLGIYKVDRSDEVIPDRFLPAASDGMKSCFYVDEKGKYLFTSDGHYIWVYDAETMELIQTISPVKEDGFFYFEENFFLLSQNRCVVLNSEHVSCYDYLTGEHLWDSLVNTEDSVSTLSKDQSLFIVVNLEKIIILDIKNGKRKAELPYSVYGNPDIIYHGEYQSPDMNSAICLSDDNRYLAFSTYQWERPELYYNFYGCLYLADLEQGTVSILNPCIDHIQNLKFSGNDLYVLSGENQRIVQGGKNHHLVFGDGGKIFSYNVKNRELNWDTDYDLDDGLNGISNYELYIIKDFWHLSQEKKILLSISGDTMALISLKNGKILDQIQYSSNIVMLVGDDKNDIRTILSDGSYTWYSPNKKEKKISYRRIIVDECTCIKGTDNAFLCMKNGEIIRYDFGGMNPTLRNISILDKAVPDYGWKVLDDQWLYSFDWNYQIYLWSEDSGFIHLPIDIEKYGLDRDPNEMGLSADGNKLYMSWDTWEDSHTVLKYNITTGKVSEIVLLQDANDEIANVIIDSGEIYYVVEHNALLHYSDSKSRVINKADSEHTTEHAAYLYRWNSGKPELLTKIAMNDNGGTDVEEDFAYCSKNSLHIDSSKENLSFNISDYTNEFSIKVISCNLSTHTQDSIELAIPEGFNIFDSIYEEKIKSERYYIIFDEVMDTFALFDDDGQCILKIDKNCSGYLFSRKYDQLWIFFSEGPCRLYQLSDMDQYQEVILPEEVSIGHYIESYDWISEDTFLICTSSGFSPGVIINESYEVPGAIAKIDHCLGFLHGTQELVCSFSADEKEQIGALPYKSLDDIISMGNEFIHPGSVTDSP